MNDTKSVQKKVKCGTVALQQLRRIALPAVITDNLELQPGDELALFYDPDTKSAVLTKAEPSAPSGARPPQRRIKVHK